MAESSEEAATARPAVPVKPLVVAFVALFGWLTMGTGGPDLEIRNRLASAVHGATGETARVTGYGGERRIGVIHACPGGERRHTWAWERTDDAGLTLLAPSPRPGHQWLALPVPVDASTRRRLRSLFGERPWCAMGQ